MITESIIAPLSKRLKTVNAKYNIAAWATLLVLQLCLVLSFIDRMVINLMVDPIREDLGISDTQVSLLMGFSFVIFYVLMGIPIAKLADRYNRKRIIISTVAIWSVFTMMCGFAGSFALLFLARVGVGAGEGGYSPASYSMIGDYFSRKDYPLATSIYGTGIFIGTGAAFLLGATLFKYLTVTKLDFPILDQLQPWQQCFVLVGLPGLLLLPILMLIKEPARKNIAALSDAAGPAANEAKLADLIAFAKSRQTALLGHVVGYSLFTIAIYAVMSWVATFYFRVRADEIEFAGTTLGWYYIIFGPAGVIAGAKIVEALHRRDHQDAIFKASTGAATVLVPIVWLIILLPGNWSFLALAAQVFFSAFPFGGAAAALLLITPNQFRAQVSAIYLLTVTLTGLGLGPLAVALLTDHIFKDTMMVGYSIATVTTICFSASAIAFVLTRKAYANAVIAMGGSQAENTTYIDNRELSRQETQ